MDMTKLSPNKLALLEKYRQGNIRKEQKTGNVIQKRQPGSYAPLSLGQQQMWLLAQLIPDVPVYNESVTVRLPGILNVHALEQSLNEVIKRHEVWRTSFPVIDGQPVQVVHPELQLELALIDLRHLPLSEREPCAIRLATERALPLFDLTTVPLLRPTLIQLDEEDYRLYLTLHHILFDGVIYEVFLPELFTHYQAFAAHKPSPLSPFSIQYSDFAVWQRERLQSKELALQIEYWKKQLANAPALLELPIDHPYPRIQSHRGARLPFALSRELVNALRALARSENASLYQLLVASFTVLLYRYTGQSDLLIGTTTAGRRPQEIRGLLGVFLNPLVLRTDLTGNPSFRELLYRVRDVVLEAHANQDVPFEYLVKELQPARNLRQGPFIQVMVSLEPPLPVLPSGWTITQSDVEAKTAKFDLFLELDDRPDGFVAWLEYNTDIFEEATAWRIIGHWQLLLQSIVEDPSQRLADLSFMTAEERHRLLIEWNATAVDYPRNLLLHQLFEAQARQIPGSIAAVYEHTKITYQVLDARANQLARYLRRQGVGPDVLVGIYLERSLDMLVALLGILKAGGAYVPLDPAYPQERLAYMLQDSQALLIISQRELCLRLPQAQQPVVCLDSERSSIEQESSDAVENVAVADNLTYIIYTSGSTGRPKGVAISHTAIVNLLFAMQQLLKITDQDIFLGITTLSFDIAVAEIFLSLSSGATLHLENRETVSDGRLLLQEIATIHPTILQATPATWTMLLEAGLTTLRGIRIISTGEALEQSLSDQLLQREPITFWNLYGPTETTIWATAREVAHRTESLSIGRPIENVQSYVLDTAMEPVPVGVPGELYIGGIDLARGYLWRPDLTGERFVPDPFGTGSGGRLYRTGDLVRNLPDGEIDFLGRIDQQVKLRGFRIELGEIETLLRQLPDIHEAIVVAREDIPGDKRLVAYITCIQEKNILAKDIVQDVVKALKDRLPDYMIPSSFVQLEALPITSAGKIDRLALPVPDKMERESENTFVPPTAIMHYPLQKIWEELLNRRPIGMRDNFFLSGGHSLLAARLVAKIERSCGKKISLSTLFANPTIEQLSEALQRQEDIDERCLIVEVQSGDKSRIPVFFLHGDPSGGSFYCFNLAQSLGKEQPFYACAPYRFKQHEPLPGFEAMAAAHLEAIRTIQPQGPYALGGFCNGGLVAYEIARQLYASGQRVDLLFLVDPSPFAYHKRIHDSTVALLGLLRMSSDQQLNLVLGLRYMYRYLRFPIDRQRYREKRRASGQQTQTITTLNALLPPGVEQLRQDWFELFRWIASEYDPAPSYPDKVTFVWTEGAVETIWQQTPEARLGETHFLHGGHVEWVRKHLDVLADFLRASLTQIQPTQNANSEEGTSVKTSTI